MNASAVALTLLAVGATVLGLASVIGRPGLALGAVTFILFAVPLASAATPVEFLPEPWGAVGQWFPPGAGATLLRDLSYFPGADATFPWLVLGGVGDRGPAARARRAARSTAPRHPETRRPRRPPDPRGRPVLLLGDRAFCGWLGSAARIRA